MGKLVIKNPEAFLFWLLLFIFGGSFWGLKGIGIAAFIILLVQIFL